MLPAGITVLEDGTLLGPHGQPLKFRLSTDGYPQVTIRIHQLVCEAFHGARPFPGAQVRHLDGDPTNNAASNLRWGTAKENAEDRKLHGTENQGERHGRSKLTEQQVLEIRALYATGRVTQKDLAKAYEVSQPIISQIVRRKRWTHI